MRIRKKCLVYRTDEAGERTLVGLFSSRRKAEAAILADCSGKKAVLGGTGPPGFPYIERIGARIRFVSAPGREAVYSIEFLVEDSEIIK